MGMKLPKWDIKKTWEAIKKYKYVLIVVLVGIIVILWPTGTTLPPPATPQSDGSGTTDIDYGLDALQRQLSDLLASVDGVGRVKIMLTVSGSPEQVYARDGSTSNHIYGNDGETVSDDTSKVAVIRGNNGDEAVVIKTLYPSYTGAVVVCEGADRPEVAYAVTRAITSLTGLTSDKITIIKMKIG